MENVNSIVITGLFVDGDVLNIVDLKAMKGSALKELLTSEFITNEKTGGLLSIDLKLIARPGILFSKISSEDSLIKDVAELLEMSGGRFFSMTVKQSMKDGES